MTEVEVTERAQAGGRGGFGSLGSIIGLCLLLWAAALAALPLNDNSFFTHLATGRLILDRAEVPSADPYSFTAPGEPWTVQSWLASLTYAGAECLAGDAGLRLVVLATFAAGAALIWRLTRPAHSVLVRLLLAAAALAVATGLWSERPFMIGVLGLALLWLALDGDVSPWVFVPAMWIWVNFHGSWVLAPVLVGAVCLGSALDRRAIGESASVPAIERRVIWAVAGGIVISAINPIGPRLLAFPLTAMTRSDVFAEIIEWQPPGYRSWAERVFLVLVVAVFLLLVRSGSWRLAIPGVVFVAAAVFAQRNVVMAVVVLVAVGARAAPAMGTLGAADRPALGRLLAGVLSVVLTAVAALGVLRPVVDRTNLQGYPTRALSWVEAAYDDARFASQMPAGNLLTVLDGPRRRVFIDDRVDMYPPAVFDDFLELASGAPGWEQVLEEHDTDLVVWSGSAPLASLFAASGDWAIEYADPSWIVARRRS